MHAVKLLVHEPSSYGFDTGAKKFRSYKSPYIDQIPGEVDNTRKGVLDAIKEDGI